MNEKELEKERMKNKIKETITRFKKKKKFYVNTGYKDNISERWTDEEVIIIYTYGYRNGRRKNVRKTN